MMQLVNCKECIGGKHDSCLNPETCLCASDKHGVSLKNGVRVDVKMNTPKDEPRFFEQCRNDREKLDAMFEDGLGENSADYQIPEMIKLMVSAGHIVSKIQIKEVINKWRKRFGIDADVDILTKWAFEDSTTFLILKQVCFALGEQKKKVMFDKDQLIEASYFIMGRYHIKRIELNGNMLFFNDKYHEKNAEPLIRRKAREILLKSKNGDVNEIVKMIEDSCRIITWKDIEDSIHLKCLTNGVYNIKEGVFVESFSPDDIILNIIPHEYNITKTWSEIDSKVTEIIENQIDRESYYDSLSTALHPYTGIDFQFGGIGQAGTGKSQICQLSIMTLGDDNVSASPIHLVAGDLTTQKDIAFNFLNIDMDMSNESIRNIDVLKRWITQDKFTARGIYEHNTTFRPMARICFMANDLYEISNIDDADAIYERTHIIKINKKFRGQEKQIKNLFQKIATPTELSGFVTYLLRNATDIFINQRIRHPINIGTVRDTWNTHGNRIKEFVETWTTKGDFRVEPVEIWNRWLSFTNLHDYKAKDKKKFKEIFDEIVGNSPTKTSKVSDGQRSEFYAYSGFRLLRDEEINENNQVLLDKVQSGTPLGNRARQSLSSTSSILLLLNITEKSLNYNILKEKVTELIELAKSSKKVEEKRKRDDD